MNASSNETGRLKTHYRNVKDQTAQDRKWRTTQRGRRDVERVTHNHGIQRS